MAPLGFKDLCMDSVMLGYRHSLVSVETGFPYLKKDQPASRSCSLVDLVHTFSFVSFFAKSGSRFINLL